MKKLWKILIALVILLVVLVIGANVLVSRKLDYILNEFVIPVAEDRLGVDVGFDDAAASILGGRIDIGGIKLGNPQGFPDPDMAVIERCEANVALGPLLSGGVTEVMGAKLSGGVLTIIRNGGRVNLQVVADNLNAEDTEGAAGPASVIKHGESANFTIDV